MWLAGTGRSSRFTSSCRDNGSKDWTSRLGYSRFSILRHSSKDCDNASRVLFQIGQISSLSSTTKFNLLPRRNYPLAMFIIIARLRRSTSKALSTWLSSITSYLSAFAFGTSVRCCNAFRCAVGRWFGGRFLSQLRTRWIGKLDCVEHAWIRSTGDIISRRHVRDCCHGEAREFF